MSAFVDFLSSYLLNSLWQVPLLFVAGWVAARWLRSTGAAIEHRVWIGTLLLQCLLPACPVMPWSWLRNLFLLSRHGSTVDHAQVSVVMGPGSALNTMHLPAALIASLAVLYSIAGVYFIAKFVWRVLKVGALRREAVELSLTGDSASCWTGCLRKFALDDVTIAASSRIFGPVTIGLRRKLVVLPVCMVAVLPELDLRTILLHEFAHISRKDFAKNLLYEALSLPVSYHPLLRLTRERIMETREMVCDQMAAGFAGRNEYARSLLRLAALLVQGMPVRTPHAIGIFDANVFERRLMRLTGNGKEVRGVQRLALIAACAALAVGTCGSAMALHLQMDASSAASAARPPKAMMVSAGVMAGNKLTGENPKYPVDAKKAKIQGAVVLRAIIGKDGSVQDLQVVSGPKELRQSSVDAVRAWKYKPYLLNGDAIEVKTTINVVYSLGG